MSGTSAEPKPVPVTGFLGWAVWALRGWAFPSFMLFTLTLAQVLLLVLLFTPAADEGVGAFAESFKVWCFGYDPATGELDWIYPVMLVVNPLMLDLVIVGVWWIPLKEVLRERPRVLLRTAALSVALVGTLAGVLYGLEPPTVPPGELPFPAEELRTAHAPPQFTLVNQDGEQVSLAALRGRVVMVTAVYSTCGFTCPMIMGQSKRAVAGLTPEERAGLTVVAITLDPEKDTRERLAEMASSQQVSAPLYNLLTGDPEVVERVLDRFGVSRRRDPETGVIDHANLFVLIDAQGKIAYRLTLGDQQERWLGTALRLLLREREEGSRDQANATPRRASD